MKALLTFIRHLFGNNKKVIFLLVVQILLAYSYLRFKKLNRLRKQQLRKSLNLHKARLILREIAIEANFTLNFSFLKYKDKALLNKGKKKDQILTEFMQTVLSYYLNKGKMTFEEYMEAISEEQALQTNHDHIVHQFEYFKDRKPEPLEIYISKFNSQSLKVIYKKYLSYIRYLVYRETKDYYHYHERFDRHLSILTNEKHLKDVFDLYVMNFDDQNAQFDKMSGAYFREFKKAQYQLMFDKQWCEETYEMENSHIQCLSLILEFGHRVKNDQWMSVNPIELRKKDHGEEIDLPQEFSLTIQPITKELMKQRYITLVSERLATMNETTCYMQIFNINPKAIKLRLLRDKVVTTNSNDAKLNSSQNSMDTIGGQSNKASARRKLNNYVPLSDKLKQGISQTIQLSLGNIASQFDTLNINNNNEGNNGFRLLENANLVESESIFSNSHRFENGSSSNRDIKEEGEKEEEEQKIE